MFELWAFVATAGAILVLALFVMVGLVAVLLFVSAVLGVVRSWKKVRRERL